MPRNVSNFLGEHKPQMCRLCLLKEDDLIYIFDPYGYQGFRLWEIIKELLQLEVSKEDGLPWTICKGCIGKVKEFKQFKATCIRSKITFLTMIANRGLVSSLATKLPSHPLLEPRRTISKRQTNGKCCEQVEATERVKEEIQVVSTDENPPREDTVPRRERDAGDGMKIHIKEEVPTDESSSDADTSFQDILHEDVSADNTDKNATSLADPLDVCSSNREEDNPCKSLKEEDRWAEFADDETQLVSDTNVMSGPLSVENVIDDSNMTGGIHKTCEISGNELKRKHSHSGLRKANARLRIDSTLPSVIPKHQVKKKVKAKEGKGSKSKGGTVSAFKSRTRTPHEHQLSESRKKRLSGRTAYVCNYRGLKCMDGKDLGKHLRGHISGDGSLTRMTTGRVLPKSSKSRIVGHSHSTPYKCETCGKEYRFKSLLSEHSLKHSTGKPFECETCGKGFKRKSEVRSHSVVHMESRPFKCVTCGKGFKREGELRKHSIAHSDVKKFGCEECGKHFKTKAYLRRHSAVHGEVRLFSCDKCERTFKWSSSLWTHNVMMHK